MATRWATSPGIALMGTDAPSHITAWARAAEDAGLGSAWIIEDYFHPGAYALAAAAAAVTARLAIGLGVVNPYTRHPALLAMETAALAGIAPGRVVLGLGSSNRHWIEAQMGIPFKAPLGGLRECVAIVRGLLAGERVTVRGEVFTVDGVKLEWSPPEAVPVLLGVKGPKALRLAGESADGVHCAVLASPEHVARVRQTAGAGRPRFTVIAYVLTAISRDGRHAREAVRPLIAHYLGVLHGQSILLDAGLGPDRTRPFREALDRGAAAAHLVDDALIDAVAVAGTPEHCRRQLARWAEAGLDAPIAVLPRDADVLEQIALCGEILVPAWREVR
ncbi:MAG TPA: LLM class flavin-dependent oxidoreductase [Methylomirabilota bacterium]|nr:LLM class flavin-dependent oxidoreductase [Methylomirabilota bacterium]